MPSHLPPVPPPSVSVMLARSTFMKLQQLNPLLQFWPRPLQQPLWLWIVLRSSKLGLNSGRELTVQELSLYRPAPFRTPVERAWIRWTWWAPRGIRRDGSPVGGMREGDQGRRERPILLKSSRQRNVNRGASQSTENPWVGSLRGIHPSDCTSTRG
jgi:hypothetical protein